MASPLSSWARTRAKPQASVLLRPSGRHEGAAEHPFPVADRAAYKESVGLSNGELNARIREAPIASVPLAGLVAIQHTVQPARVQEYVDDPLRIPSQRGPVPTDVPIVVKTAGVKYIHDGHHRSTARKLSGDTSMAARYVDLDADRTRRGSA